MKLLKLIRKVDAGEEYDFLNVDYIIKIDQYENCSNIVLANSTIKIEEKTTEIVAVLQQNDPVLHVYQAKSDWVL